MLAGLVARGVFVRMPFVAPQDRCIRVTVGRPADLDAFAAALPEALAARLGVDDVGPPSSLKRAYQQLSM